MANMGKQKVTSRQGTNLGQRKSIFEPSKFPQPSPNINPSPETTDLSGYRQPQPGEMMANVMDSLSTSKSASPPNYITGKQLPAPKRQEREVNMAPINQLKAHPRQSNLSEKPIQKQEESIPNQTGLPDNIKAVIENLSGYSLDNVRVYYNSPKPAQLQALAYTQGTVIHVAPGQEKHLPHEAWHVVQQMQGRVKPTMQMKGIQINDDAGLEREADTMGERAIHSKQRKHDQMKSTYQMSNISTSLPEKKRTASLCYEGEIRPSVYQFQTRIYYVPPNNRLGTYAINNIDHRRSLHNATQKELAAYHSGYATSAQAIAMGANICNHYVSYNAIATAIIQQIFGQLMNPSLDDIVNWVQQTYDNNLQGQRMYNNGNFNFQFGAMPASNINDVGAPGPSAYDEFEVEQELDDVIYNLANDPQNLFYWPATNGQDPDVPTGPSNSPMPLNTVTRVILQNRLKQYRTYLQNSLGLAVP